MALIKLSILCCLIIQVFAGSPSYTVFYSSSDSSSSSSQPYPFDGSPCETCNNALRNGQPLSLINCNPQGQPKYYVTYKLNNGIFSGFCTNFFDVSGSIPPQVVLYYVTDGDSLHIDYYLDITSSYTVTPPSSVDSSSPYTSETFETFYYDSKSAGDM